LKIVILWKLLLGIRTFWDKPIRRLKMDDEVSGKKVEFVTISAEKIPFGRNNFIEIARKKAITEDGENEFISLSRGYYLPDGSERFKKSLTIPDDPQIKAFIVEKISSM